MGVGRNDREIRISNFILSMVKITDIYHITFFHPETLNMVKKVNLATRYRQVRFIYINKFTPISRHVRFEKYLILVAKFLSTPNKTMCQFMYVHIINLSFK